MTIETVSRQMTSLKRREVVALPGGRGVIILDRALLARAAAG
ncbi:helix-turn-helix domain-containing protein [Sphingomonas aerolata]